MVWSPGAKRAQYCCKNVPGPRIWPRMAPAPQKTRETADRQHERRCDKCGPEDASDRLKWKGVEEETVTDARVKREDKQSFLVTSGNNRHFLTVFLPLAN